MHNLLVKLWYSVDSQQMMLRENFFLRPKVLSSCFTLFWTSSGCSITFTSVFLIMSPFHHQDYRFESECLFLAGEGRYGERGWRWRRWGGRRWRGLKSDKFCFMTWQTLWFDLSDRFCICWLVRWAMVFGILEYSTSASCCDTDILLYLDIHRGYLL